MLQDVQKKVADELPPGETLLWCGKPRGGIRWYLSDITEIPFSIIWLVAVIYINYELFAWELPFIVAIIFRTFALFFIGFGILFAMRKWIDKWNRERTYYGLTDRNIIIVCDFVRKRANKFPLHELGAVTLIPEDEVCGTIDFGLERYKHLRFRSPGMNFRLPVKLPFLPGESAACYRFELIENAANVYRQVEDAATRQRREGSSVSFPDSPVSSPRQQKFAWLRVVLPLVGIAIAGPHLIDFSKKMLADFSRRNDERTHKPTVKHRKHTPSTHSPTEWIERTYAEKKAEYTNRSAADLHAEGLRFFNENKYFEAIIPWLYESEKVQNANTLNNLSIVYTKVNLCNKAAECSRQALALDAGFVKGYKSLGAALLCAGDNSGARDSYLEALKRGANDDFVYANLGLAERNLTNEEKAMEYLRKAKGISPAYPEIDAYINGRKFIAVQQ